ncbi:MAG: 4Fe-4S cluster-binding domain-containing protein [Spirochaetes bacterium]|nr:4Fe-4S cluster-binding domain-containing protein [Spirochaetota bacterium]
MIDRACLSINNTCNLHCFYCNFRQMDLIKNDESFTTSDLDIVLHNIYYYSKQNKLPIFKMGIVGAGEPLLNFETIKHIIDYAKKKDIENIFTFYTISNGTILNEDMLLFFYENKKRITLNISLDGYEELHNYGKEEFKRTIDGIKLYESIFHERPIINCNVSRKTLENKETVINFFIEHKFENVNFSQIVDINDNSLLIGYEDYLNFLQFVKEKEKIAVRQNRDEKKYDCRTYGQLCGVGRTNIFITKQGIFPCCRFYKNNSYRIGDFDTSLFEVEKTMSRMLKPVKDGECYFNRHILKRSDL